MQRRSWQAWPLLAVLVLGAASACSGGDETGSGPAPAEEAMEIASAALTAAGATPLGAAVGGDAQTEQSASVTLPSGTTVGVFAACTGGGSVGLDLAGRAHVLDCDGQGHQLDDLPLPDDALPSFRVTQPNDVPSGWGVAFAQLEAGAAG